MKLFVSTEGALSVLHELIHVSVCIMHGRSTDVIMNISVCIIHCSLVIHTQKVLVFAQKVLVFKTISCWCASYETDCFVMT